MQYKVGLEIAAAFFLAVLYVFLWVQYGKGSQVNRKFRMLTLCVLAANVLDVVTACTISYSAAVPQLLNLLLNTAYLVVDALAGFYFLCYVYAYICPGRENVPGLLINRVCTWIYIATLALNLFTGHYIYFDANGQYQHGIFYPILFAVPLYYMVFASLVLWRNRDCFQKKQRTSIVIFTISAVLGTAVQALFLPNVLIGLFGVALGVTIVAFSLETPDYQRLVETMDVLSQTKEEAERDKEKAMAADKAKGEFLANMSHELRTPLNAVLGYNGLIMSGTKESHIAEYAGNIQNAGRTLLSIISDILDFSVLDEGKLQLHATPYSTASLLEDVVTYAEYHTGKKGLQLVLSVDENIPGQLLGDSVRLTQVINNLVSNAAKYTKQGYVKLQVEWKKQTDEAGTLTVSVADSGIGMREEDIEKISESFLRFEKEKTEGIQGLGLGLSIVTRLLHLMGGELTVESEYEQGSTFAFSVEQKIMEEAPLGDRFSGAARNDKRPQEEEREADVFYAPGARILAVDDNLMNLDLFVGMLKDTGMTVDTASDGREALKLLEAHNYDLIFIDHMMPDMDGIMMLGEMHRRELARQVPVVVLTANAVAGAWERYMEAGFDEYLSKPVRRGQLLGVIRHYLPDYLIVQKTESKEAPAKKDDFLSRISFLDTTMAMGYLGDSEQFYQEMLASYLHNNRRVELQQYFEERDWENYRNGVHALKSTSLAIGAVALSGLAKELELAAKKGDTVFIEENHGEMMQEYELLLARIEVAIAEDTYADETTETADKREIQILVVDDDPLNLRIAQNMLSKQYQVSAANSGTDALKFLENHHPDLILLDLHMPGMDGFAVQDALKKNPKWREIPVIFLTADEDCETEIQGFQAGAMDFIKKPFAADIVIARVQRILELDHLKKCLQEEVRRQTKHTENLSLQIIEALAGAIDAKDTYTSGHSKRVAHYAREIARRVGKSEQEQRNIYFAAMLHDVGKIGVPDQIINKPDKLTDEEYAIVKRHPVIGADILKNVSEIPGIVEGARWHHERYDGGGYPDGLRGEEIPEGARIICVADAYDAMTSKRSYRDVLPKETVKDQLKQGIGTQFDATFAQIMLQMMEEDVDYKLREEG